jgi:hypothetical protein
LLTRVGNIGSLLVRGAALSPFMSLISPIVNLTSLNIDRQTFSAEQ